MTKKIKTPFVRALMEALRKKYGNKAFYSPYYDYGQCHALIVRPFKTVNMEFWIGLPDGKDHTDTGCIIATHYGDRYENGDEDSKVYIPKEAKEFENIDTIMQYLQTAINEYVKGEKEFYDEGIALHKEWGDSEEEAARLEAMVFGSDRVKELGLAKKFDPMAKHSMPSKKLI